MGCAGKKFLEDYSSEVKTTLHTGLDIVSMIPDIGSVASCANASWYLAEGDYANAGLSAVSMIPGVGTAVKGGTLAVKGTALLAKNAPKVAGAASKALPVLVGGAKKIGSSLATTAKKGRTSANQMQRQVEKGIAPREVKRVDAGNTNTRTKDHIHFHNGTSINYDGTRYDSIDPKFSNSVREWMKDNLWNPGDWK